MNFTKNGEKLVIASALRTPIGQASKSLSQFDSYELGSFVIEELLTRNPVLKKEIDLVVAGETLNPRYIADRTGEFIRQQILLSALTEATDCQSARKRDPRRYDAKRLSERSNLQEGWGHGWTPTKVRKAKNYFGVAVT